MFISRATAVGGIISESVYNRVPVITITIIIIYYYTIVVVRLCIHGRIRLFYTRIFLSFFSFFFFFSIPAPLCCELAHTINGQKYIRAVMALADFDVPLSSSTVSRERHV